MRKVILAVAATATLGVMSATAGAMPIGGTVAPSAQPDGNIQKTEVIIRRTIVRRPYIRRVVPIRRCTTVVTAGRRVTRCVVR